MYEAVSSAELDALVKEHGITHIIVDRDARESYYFYAREYVIADTYEAVFSYGEDENRFTVYDTSKKLVK